MAQSSIPATMRAAVFQEPNNVQVQNIGIPEIRSDEILVKLVSASICGSDLVPYLGYHGEKTVGLAAGHEGVGIVAKVGTMVCAFKVGDRVGFTNTMRACQACIPCKAGEAQFCESGKLNQGFDTHGFLAEYAVVSPQFCTSIADSLPLERMSPLFCAGITAFRAAKRLDLPARGIVGIFGLGGVGRLAVQMCLALGFRVLGFDVSAHALDETRALGAEGVVDSSNPEAMAALVRDVCGSRLLDGAIVASGVGAAYEAAIDLTGFQGTVVTVGVPHQPISLSILPLVKKALRLQGTQTGNPLELEEMMRLVTKHHIVPDVELHTIDRVPELLAMLAQGKLQKKTGIRL